MQASGLEIVIGIIFGAIAFGGNVAVCSPHGLLDRDGVSYLGRAINIALLSSAVVVMFRSRPFEIDSEVDIMLIAVMILRGSWVRKIIVSACLTAMASGPFLFS